MAQPRTRRPRRRFDDDFKAQAVRLILDDGKSIPSVACDLDLMESTLRTWWSARSPIARTGAPACRRRQ